MNIRRLIIILQMYQIETQHLRPRKRNRDQNNALPEWDPIVSHDLELHEEISQELIGLRGRNLEIMLLEERVGLPSMKSRDRAKLRAEVANVNEAAKRIENHNIIELNSVLYAAAYVTTERMGMLRKRNLKLNQIERNIKRRTILEEES